MLGIVRSDLVGSSGVVPRRTPATVWAPQRRYARLRGGGRPAATLFQIGQSVSV